MRNKTQIKNTDQPSTEYPMGRIRNDQGGIGIGTPIVEELYGDIHETVTYFMEESKTVPNGLPDNYTNGHQIAEAIKEVGGKFDRMFTLTKETNTMRIDARLDNMKVGEFFVCSIDSEDINVFNKIKGTDNAIYNLNINFNYNKVLKNDLFIVVKRDNLFESYIYRCDSSLKNIIDKIVGDAGIVTNTFKILHSVSVDVGYDNNGSIANKGYRFEVIPLDNYDPLKHVISFNTRLKNNIASAYPGWRICHVGLWDIYRLPEGNYRLGIVYNVDKFDPGDMGVNDQVYKGFVVDITISEKQ